VSAAGSNGASGGIRFYETSDTVTRWVQPFESVPEFKVEMRRLSEAESNRMYDRHGVFPGSPKQSMTRWSGLMRDIFAASVVSWEGAEKVIGQDEKLLCNDETKKRIATVMVERDEDGEKTRTALSQILVQKFSEMEAGDAKN
jgi:hypothetical protein